MSANSFFVGRNVCCRNSVSTLCEVSEMLTEWNSETIPDDVQTDRGRCKRCKTFKVRFGRKMAILGSMLVSTTASLVGAFMPEYWSYLTLRLLLGFTRTFLRSY